MSKTHRYALLSIVILLLTTGAVTGQATASAEGITVSGSRLMRDGAPFTPLGFTMVGLLTPPGCHKGNAGARHLNQHEMDVAKDVWHANTLRFQVSYNGLTGYDASERAQYLQRIKNGVALARANDLDVIISLQDQGIGCGPGRALPPLGALGAWRTLAATFEHYSYVMFELWNEPDNDAVSGTLDRSSALYAQRHTWADWLDGRTTAIQPDKRKSYSWPPFIPTGHQQLVNVIRSTGAKNVVIAEGALKAEHLNGMPMLNDPLAVDQIAYAAHMYYFQTGRADWDRRFGYLTATKPVIMTEWNYSCSGQRGVNQARIAQDFLPYLKEKHVGMMAWSLDMIGTLISDWNYTPTSSADCRNKAGGLTVRNHFRAYG